MARRKCCVEHYQLSKRVSPKAIDNYIVVIRAIGCTMANFFEDLEAGNPYYISGTYNAAATPADPLFLGASKIFDKNKELHGMVDSPAVVAIEPGRRTATQMFMGVPTMGSDIHCATGINV